MKLFRKKFKPLYKAGDPFEIRVQAHPYTRKLYAKIVKSDLLCSVPKEGDKVLIISGRLSTYLLDTVVTNWNPDWKKHPLDDFGYIQHSKDTKEKGASPLHRFVKDTPRVRELIKLVNEE